MIKNLIFDFGKVLVDYEFETLLRSFFDTEEEYLAFLQVVGTQDFIDKCDREAVPFSELIGQYQIQYPQWHSQFQSFHDRYLEFVTVEMPGMRDLLHRMRAEGYKLYGLTNWNSTVHDVIRKYDILQLLDGRVISSEEQVIKPERAIYDKVVERFGLNPAECVFADDKPANVKGAKDAGWHAILFKNAAQYERELREILQAGKSV